MMENRRPELPQDVSFRAMTHADIPAALKVIRQHSNEDAEAAQYSYKRSIRGQYVLHRSNRIIGVTGWRDIPEADRAYWLSWTYLDAHERGQGLGFGMLASVLEELRQRQARKLFVYTSDLRKEADGLSESLDVYGQALRVYQRIGFVEEFRHPDYYGPGESLIALGLRLEERWVTDLAPHERRNAKLLGADEINETNDAYVIDWKFVSGAGARQEDLKRLVEKVHGWNGRVVFAGVASDALSVQSLFLGGGFKQEGRLADFFEDGVDDVHFRLDLR